MFVISVSACSQSWYVSAEGSDTNAGTSESRAFKTLARAVQAAQTGDVKRITVVGTLTQETENRSEDAMIFMIEDSGDREILITGTKNATLQERERNNMKHVVLGIVGNSKIKLENITVTRGWAGIGVINGAVLTIGKNTLVSENHNTEESTDGGAGVMIVAGTLIMTDGAITNNTGGGGVYLKEGAAFTISGGTISGNSAQIGGGISAYGGTLTISGKAAITGNSAEFGGGGVAVSRTANVTMSGGTISNNTAKERGGGVFVAGPFDKNGNLLRRGTFAMSGGVIEKNTAPKDPNVWIDMRAGQFKHTGGRVE
jgi:hypothetical protein